MKDTPKYQEDACPLILLVNSVINFFEGRWQLGLYGNIPNIGWCEVPAFYRIFLGHDDRKPIGECEITARKAVMIRKRVLDRLDTEAS